MTAEKPEEVGPAWDEALRADRPCVVEFRTDPAVPPIPPHATWDQMEKAVESIVRCDSDRISIVGSGRRDGMGDRVPGGT